MGLRGKAVKNYVQDWIVNVEDITEKVKSIDEIRRQKKDITSMLPIERLYQIEV